MQSQNVQAALGRIGAAPTPQRQQFQLTIKTQGRLTRHRRVRQHRRARQSRRLGRAGQGRGARRSRRQDARSATAASTARRRPRSASTSRPAPTPSTSRARSARCMDELKQRFPDDLAYDVFWDTTVFVTSTIEEVVRTLVIAFVLVAIVVFLFLGKLRTTLIPLVAVPVSIIGTFAVMLVIGYSANTVSLLALVLAIGIVVDDAIVVIENVERVIEEEPELSIPGRDQEGDGRDHRADHRHHAGAAVGVRAGGVHSRHQRPAVPPVRRRGLDRDDDLGDQRADPQPGAVLGAAEARRDAAAARCATCWAPSTGCATAMSAIVRRLVRLRGLRPASSVAGRRGRRRSACSGSRRRASCRRRTRAPSSPPCGCPRAPRSTAPSELVAQVEDIIRPIPGVQGVLSVVGLNFIDYVASSNQAFFVVRLKPYEERTAPDAERRRDHRAACGRRLAAIQGAIVFPFNLPPILGLGSTGGFQYVLRGAAGPVADRPRGRDARPDWSPPTSSPSSPASSAPSPPTRRRSVSTSTATRRRCWASRSATSSTRCNRPWAASTSTTSTCSAAPGRSMSQAEAPLPRRHRGHLPRLCPQQHRRHGADPRAGPGPARPGAAGGHPLQRLPRRRSSTARPSPATAPARRWRRWSGSRPPPCRPATASNGPARRLQEKAASGQTGIVLGLAVLFAYLFLVALYESWNIPAAGAAVGQRRRAGRDRRGGSGGPRLRRLCPDRPRRAGGAGRQERHPDRRVRRRAAAPRQVDPRGGDRRRAAALPPGDDDQLRLHLRPAAAGRSPTGAGAAQPPRGRHAGVRRHARRRRCSASS